MVVHDSSKNHLRIEIPLSSPDGLIRYQNALLSILRRIRIDKCETEFKEDLKAVYELLSHLQIEECITKSVSEMSDEKFKIMLQS